jgi:hypothetical protein
VIRLLRPFCKRELSGGYRTDLVDHTVPSVTCIIDDDVDLAVAELCGLLDERVEVFVVEHVAWGGNGFATALVDGVGDALCLFCFGIVVSCDLLSELSSSLSLNVIRSSWQDTDIPA